MRARLLLLSVLDSTGRHGLAKDIRAITDPEVAPIPIPTGYLTWQGKRVKKIHPLPARTISTLLESALEARPEGIYLGLLPRVRTVKAVANALQSNQDAIVVLAPFPIAREVQGIFGRRALTATRDLLVPESTVVVLPMGRIQGLVPEADEGMEGARSAGTKLVEEGARAAWMFDEETATRGMDMVVHTDGAGFLDYPPPREGSEPHGGPATLAALLARGVLLRDAIEQAHRHCRGFDRLVHPVGP